MIEIGWLIENTKSKKWLKARRNGYVWTRNGTQALRFARKEDAVNFMKMSKTLEFTNCVATEHMWIDRASS